MQNQVRDIFIVAKKSNVTKIQEFIKEQEYKSVKIKVVGMTEDAKNVGDVLRTAMGLNLFKDDFLLVRGDVITNIDVHPALKMHYYIK